MSERQILGGTSAATGGPLWHYQYKIGQMLHHFDAETYDACVEALLRARDRSPHLTAISIFEGGKRSEAIADRLRELLAS